MPKKSGKKNMTLDKLAVMVGKGFNDVTSRMATKQDLEGVRLELKNEINDVRLELKNDIHGVKQEVAALKSNVNNYLELSEKRYVELKRRDVILAKWIKLVAHKVKVPVDLSEFEKF
jgi:hypothetical protein